MSQLNTAQTLYVYYNDVLVGELCKDYELTYSFVYSNLWLKYPQRFQLSLAMPLQKEPFGNKVTLSFFENLLPEGHIRDILEKSHQLHGPLEFLKEFGEDCAGAVIVSSAPTSPFKKLEGKEVKIKLESIYEAIDQKHFVAEMISEMEPGYLSLAGAQDKFSALFRDGNFYLPAPGRPTSHIVKVPINRLGIKESVYNEFYCMKLGQAVGFNIPECFIFEKEGKPPLYVIERYDRFKNSKGIVYRLHQQDFCQAQGVVSEQKYEDKGGPTLKNNYELIKSHTTIKQRPSALFAYLDWICFNILIGNNNCHSKNLSFLLHDHKIELAPFYDLMCTAIYPRLKKDFSFKVGDRNDPTSIGKKQLEMVDRDLNIKLGTMRERMLLMRDQLMEHKDELANEIYSQFPYGKIIKRVAAFIGDRCKGLKIQGL